MNTMTSVDAAKKHAVECLESLHQFVQDIEEKRKCSEHTLNDITKTQEKINQEDKVSPYYPQELKNLYENAIAEAAEEEKLIRSALEKIWDFRKVERDLRFLAKNAGNKEVFGQGTMFKMLDNLALSIPLFIGNAKETAPPLCGAIPAAPHHIASPGDMVAAFVKEIKKNENLWILAEVVNFDTSTNKYIVNDIEEEGKENEKYTLNKQKVVPLPIMRANPATEPYALYPINSQVMALYPTTTCFYKAFVHELPTSAFEGYKLRFEDLRMKDGLSEPIPVAQRYIFLFKDKKGKNC